jgi:hypothetical protein
MKYARKSIGLLAICLAIFFVVRPAFSALRQLVIRHFDDEVIVSKDGTIDVTETIQAHFSGENWHGLYRMIPTEYTNDEGLNYSLLIDHITVADSDGHSLKYEQSREGRYTKFRLYIRDADD